MMTRITKKDYYSTILDLVTLAEGNGFGLPEGMTYDGIAEFVNHEVELLEAKAASAAKRAAAKRAAGDELREMVLNTLSDTEFMTIDDIVAVSPLSKVVRAVRSLLTSALHSKYSGEESSDSSPILI